MAKLDYFLKQQPNNKKNNTKKIRQYFVAKKENITSYRINYHGGYSKLLYTSWNTYVTNTRKELSHKNYKLNSKIQNINIWVSYFN
jgi:hypothetical protein